MEGIYINSETIAAQNHEAPAHGLKSPLARPPVHPQVARCRGVLWQRLWQRWQCKQFERLASCVLSFPQCASCSARQLALDAFLASCNPTLLHSFHLFAYASSRQYVSITSDFHRFLHLLCRSRLRNLKNEREYMFRV